MKETNNLQIEYLPVDSLKPYKTNARKHKKKDIAAIASSIMQFGFDDPIGIWSEKNLIVEGHGRLAAAKKLGMKEVPCIRLDHLTDEERRAYALAHNRTAELSSWFDEFLADELQDLQNFDLKSLGFDDLEEKEKEEKPLRIMVPQYVPTGEQPSLESLVDSATTEELISEIMAADIDKDTKDFLIKAAHRHDVFNYKNIAEYYVHASAEVQRLMERSALVIIDINDAIAFGYAELSKKVHDLIE